MSPITLAPSPVPLRDALYALSLTKRVPDADLLDTMIRRYPEHAEALTEFAIELAVDALIDVNDAEDATPVTATTSVSPAVSRAMSRFQNRRHAVIHGESIVDNRVTAQIATPNPFAALDRKAFRAFANRIGANNVFVQKLRDRQITPETMTPGFQQWMADELRAPLDVVVAHFAASGVAATGGSQFFKADGKPDTTLRQTFAEAVASSGLSEEQQRQLLTR